MARSFEVFEVRGLKLLTAASNMTVGHFCSFAISMRLPTRSYWVQYFAWVDAVAAPGTYLQKFGTISLVTRGLGLPPLFNLMISNFPKRSSTKKAKIAGSATSAQRGVTRCPLQLTVLEEENLEA